MDFGLQENEIKSHRTMNLFFGAQGTSFDHHVETVLDFKEGNVEWERDTDNGEGSSRGGDD